MRRIVPIGTLFTSTPWHPEPQWILYALDVDKQADRSFAMKDILEINPAADAEHKSPEVP